MKLVPWNHVSKPANVFNSFFDDDLLAPTSWDKSWSGWSQVGFAAVDVKEKENEYSIKLDLPGLNKDEIRVDFDNGELQISGERKESEDSTVKGVHRIERKFGRFSRTIRLGGNVDAAKLKASYRDGVLEVVAPKADASLNKSIKVE